jgi:hypothetical protein
MRNPLPMILMFAAACGADAALGSGVDSTGDKDEDLAIQIGAALSAACPLGAPGDEAARLDCGDKLARLDVLRDNMAEPFLWGAQGAGKPLDLYENNLTRFNPLVWRKMYASLFMFGSDFRVEVNGAQTLLHMPYAFRGALDAGSYPYPFWHSKGKWDSYQLATEVVLVLENGHLLGGMRGEAQDPARPYVAHTFDGQWSWTTPEGIPQPTAMLYSNLFSPSNTMIPVLDQAFRQLETRARTQNCAGCHSPDNSQKVSQLVLLNYPNQAIYARNEIVAELEANTMPMNVGTPSGIPNATEREALLTLARAFQAAAEQALRLEGERVAQVQ